MGMKTEDLPNGTGRVLEAAASEAEPAAVKARAARTPPIDIIGGRRLTLYSDGTPGVFEGVPCPPGRATMGMKTENLPNRTSSVFEGAASEAEPAAAKPARPTLHLST